MDPVVVGEGPAVLQLLAGEDEALLVGRDALLVLDLGLGLGGHPPIHACHVAHPTYISTAVPLVPVPAVTLPMALEDRGERESARA